MNNISYADDTVLLSTSISGLRKLVGICERYAEAHGLRYNASKSELIEFKAVSKYCRKWKCAGRNFGRNSA